MPTPPRILGACGVPPPSLYDPNKAPGTKGHALVSTEAWDFGSSLLSSGVKYKNRLVSWLL